MGAEQEVIQPVADSVRQAQSSSAIDWNVNDNSWSQANNTDKPCRMVGDTLVCDGNIYGNERPANYAEAFRAFIPLAKDLGLSFQPSQPAVYRASEVVPAYYQQGTFAIPSGLTAEQPVQPYFDQQSNDQYYYHQQPGQPGRPGEPGQAQPMPVGPLDPFSYHQNDKTAPVVPPFKPLPDLPPPPTDAKPPVTDTKPPVDTKPANQPKPADQPQPKPCQPCRPCRPRDGGCGWYPGKIAGRVVGRMFGGGRRCR